MNLSRLESSRGASISSIRQNAAGLIKNMEKIKVEQHGFTMFSWFAGWMFTIGFLHLPFWQGILAIVLWPYYIGLAVSALVQR